MTKERKICAKCEKSRSIGCFKKTGEFCVKCVLGKKGKKRSDQESLRAMRLRSDIFFALGDKCNWPGCNWTDRRALQIDHVNGNGMEERRKFSHPSGSVKRVAYYRHIWENVHTGEYQLLCANHNWIKRYEEKEAHGKHTQDFLDRKLSQPHLE